MAVPEPATIGLMMLGGYMGQRLKILPIEWFYGGEKPVDNPSQRHECEPIAKPGM